MTPRLIALFAFDGVQLLDVTGPASVFGMANSMSGEALYEIQIVAERSGLVRSSCGVSVEARALCELSPESVDTFLVTGGSAAAMGGALEDATAREWIPRQAGAARRFGSICAGAVILAELGLLGDLRVATHWANSDDLARRFPELSVDAESLFVVDGRLWTSAGISTGVDMALAMVESDVGRALADKVARFMVLYLRRPGHQSQFSDLLKAQASEFDGLIDWIRQRLDQRIDVPALAGKAGLSERTFYRRFVEATGETPARFVENIRLDAARTLLSTDLPLKSIAARAGLRTAAHFTAAFERRFGVTPALFRQMNRP